MADVDGTYSKLIEIEREKQPTQEPPKTPRPSDKTPPAKPQTGTEPKEDLATTPYISQNYRFTEDELKWLRKQSYSLSERLGSKVSQNTILRLALQFLRDACSNNRRNPLLEIVSRLRK